MGLIHETQAEKIYEDSVSRGKRTRFQENASRS